MFDLLFRGGLVIDGTGAAPVRADVGIRDGRIAAVGALRAARAAVVRDIDGLAIVPGFIDAHTHDDRLLLTEPDMTPKASQGITTVVTGNCGISLAPLGAHDAVAPLNLVAGPEGPRFDSFRDYLAALEASPPAINAATLVGHTTLRAVAMEALERPANDREIGAMRALVSEALAAGAIGVSTGTFYGPAHAATAEEVVAVLEPLRGSGALIASHIRDEGDHVMEAMEEVIAIARRLGVRQVISHHKVQGRANFGRSRETLALLDRQGSSGAVCIDCYPYSASSTILRRDSVRQAARVLVAWSQAVPEAAGRYLDELAAERSMSQDELIDALQPAGAIYFSMDEGDVERILSHPGSMVGSDGLPHDRFPHPRLWGAFPRVLGHYCRERRLFPLEEAVHKMTGLTATRFGLTEIGFVRPGLRADLTVFDPATVEDVATFAEPTRPARGIIGVYVGGVATCLDGRPTGARNGKVLRRAA